MAGFLYPFTYTAATTLVTPLPVSDVVGATAVPEAAIVATAAQNALAVNPVQKVGLIGSGIY
jgi:hypothetical protein